MANRMKPLLVFAILTALAGLIYLPAVSKYFRLRSKSNQLDEQIKKLEQEIKILEEEEHLLRTDTARLEEVAREELGLVKPGEIVYKVIEEVIPSK